MDKQQVAIVVGLAQQGALIPLVTQHDAVMLAIDESFRARFKSIEKAMQKAGIVAGTPLWKVWSDYESLVHEQFDLIASASIVLGAMIERKDGLIARILSD